MIRKDIKITRKNDYLIVEDDLRILENIKNKINKKEYNALCHNILESNREDSTTRFFINKQCAYNDSFHMSDMDLSQLGDIEVEIHSDNLNDAIKWISDD